MYDQSWCFLAPLLEQRHPLPIGHYVDWPRRLNKYLTDNIAFGAFDKLASLHAHHESAKSYFEHSLSLGDAGRSAIETLPSEVLDLVIYQLSPQDAIAFGFCARRVWSQVLSYIRRDIRNSFAVWARTPLICTGAQLRDLPPAMYDLFPKIKEVQDAFIAKYPDQDSADLLSLTPPIQKWNLWAITAFDYVQDIVQRRQTWFDALSVRLTSENIAPTTTKTMQNSLEHVIGAEDQGLQAGDKWLLRNLTTCEFVRLEIRDDNKFKDIFACVHDVPWLTLDTVLLTRVHWSMPNSWGDAQQNKWAPQGVWAAHQFDVVPNCNCRHNLGREWKDVTSDVVEEMKEYNLPHCPPTHHKRLFKYTSPRAASHFNKPLYTSGEWLDDSWPDDISVRPQRMPQQIDPRTSNQPSCHSSSLWNTSRKERPAVNRLSD